MAFEPNTAGPDNLKRRMMAALLGRFERVGHRVTGDRTGPNKSGGAGWEFVHVCIDDHSRRRFLRDQAQRDGG
ncbi:hypothetical protein CQ10_33350 [Bradyrhizobium valentinum]|nr:hypothetical protein CQ10_33350 [Bradyrhizobium valentinum]